MSHLKVNELVAAAYVAAPNLPPAEAELMRCLAARLDVTFTALKEAMDQRSKRTAKVPDEISPESEFDLLTVTTKSMKDKLSGKT